MALVLSRKPGEAITVSGPATIRLSHDSPRVRLLVTAEPGVRILREELDKRLAVERRHDPESILDSQAQSRLDALCEQMRDRCYQCWTPTQPGLTICPVCGSPLWTGIDNSAG